MKPTQSDGDIEHEPEAEEMELGRAAAAPEDSPVATFDRALSSDLIEKLQTEWHSKTGGWWRDVLEDPNLVIAPRGNSLDVYWRGARLFHVSSVGSFLSISTHEKYLLDPALKGQVSMQDGAFRIETLRERGFLKLYLGGQTLKAMKTAAGLYADVEKSGCHEIAVLNSTVIDCEIAFPRPLNAAGSQGAVNYGRADIAALETYGQDVRLVFWEAKAFRNKELRSAQGLPLVFDQIARYRKYLSEHQTQILKSYTGVAKSLVALKGMGWTKKLSSLVEDLAEGRKRLVMGDAPKVGLLIFGFDAAQRDDKAWGGNSRDPADAGHLPKLRRHLGAANIVAVGDAKSLQLPNQA